jgi:hypothetical protein
VLTSLVLGLLAMVYIVQHRQHVAMRFTVIMVLIKGIGLIVVGRALSFEGFCAVVVFADVLNILLHIGGLRGVVQFSRPLVRPAVLALVTGTATVVLFFLVPVDAMPVRMGAVALCLLIYVVSLQIFGIVDVLHIQKEFRLP